VPQGYCRRTKNKCQSIGWEPGLKTDFEMTATYDDPLDEVEQFLVDEQILFERPSEFEIQFSIAGTWCDYPLWFRWLPNPDLLQIELGIEAKVPQNRHLDVADLIIQINERLLIGHFDMWKTDRTLVFRHGQILSSGQAPSETLAKQMSRAATDAAEVLVPALNFLLWSEKTAAQSVEAAMFETLGEA